MIGIKTADGAFFPIMEEGKAAKRRLVLTTAHDAQTHVQIDLYKTSSMSMETASYVGTLIVENITQTKKGAPSIELVISYGANGELSAAARDLDHPDDKHLLVASMLPHEDKSAFTHFDIMDLDIDGAVKPPKEISGGGAAVKRPKPVFWVVVAAGLVLLAALGLLWFFMPGFASGRKEVALNPDGLQRGENEPEVIMPGLPLPELVEPAAAPPAPPPPAVSFTPRDEPPAEARAEDALRHSGAPAPSAVPPAVIPAGGVKYKLRWGDTLWDVSEAFYRTPWRYGYIARYNGIRNPNRIVAGSTITVPPLQK
jgi:hypothetical protein